MKKIILGHLRDMRLTEARQECNRLKTLRAEGRDPLAQRRINAEEESSRLQAARQAVAATRTAVLAQREVAQRDKNRLRSPLLSASDKNLAIGWKSSP